MKKCFILILLSLVCVPFVFSESTYPVFGGVGGDFFSSDLSKFNQYLTEDNIADVLSLSDPQGVPLVEDLDGDGVNEIIIIDSGTIGFYHAQLDANSQIELVGVGGFSTSATVDGDYWSNMLTYDIDNDGFSEVIVHSMEAQHLYVISWNGSHSSDGGFDLGTYWGGASSLTADVMLGCGDVDGCVFVWNERNKYVSGLSVFVHAAMFNSTDFQNDVNYICNVIDSAGGQGFCFPKFSSVPYDSVNDKYYFTYGFYSATVELVEIDINSSGHCEFEKMQNTHTPTGIYNDCGRGITEISSPVTAEFSTTDEGNEIGYGFMDSDDDYKLVVYKSNMAELDEYPEIFNTDGRLISNPFTAKATDGTTAQDICIVGYDSVERKVTVLCAGKSGDFLYNNNQFSYYLDVTDFNVSALSVWTASSHAIESLQSNFQSEILTPYGVFELEDVSGDCYLLGNCHAYLRYENPIKEPVGLLSVDLMNEGYEDLLGLTSTNFYYIDDGFINQNAYLTYCTKINPCLDSTWQLHKANDTNFTNKIRVSIIPTDPEGDIVSARAVLYQGEPNEQDTGWVGNFSSGTEITVTQFVELYPNETTAGSTLRLYWRDSENHFDDSSYQDFIFDVQNDGVVRGDCYTCAGVTEAEYEAGASGSCFSDGDCASNEVCDDGLCVIVPDACYDSADCPEAYFCNDSHKCEALPTEGDNAITEGVKGISAAAGVPISILILILVGAAIFGIFREPSISNNVKIPTSIIVSLVALGVAVKLGLLSYIWIVLLVLAFLGGVAVLVAKVVRG